MKIKKNDYKKVCDMAGCKNIADYYIDHKDTQVRTDICKQCMLKLYKEIKKVIYDKKHS